MDDGLPEYEGPEHKPNLDELESNRGRTTTLDSLREHRTIYGVLAPSGFHYDIRPVNLQRHALTGNLPETLRRAAMKGARGVNEFFEADDATMSEQGLEVRGYLDELVAAVIVGPSLWVEGQEPREDNGWRGTVNAEALELIPPVDYKWALDIAFMEEDRDGEGRRLWGREPLSMFARFRLRHGCGEDCPGCARTRRDFSSPLG
jgi:hypothetical protein